MPFGPSAELVGFNDAEMPGVRLFVVRLKLPWNEFRLTISIVDDAEDENGSEIDEGCAATP